MRPNRRAPVASEKYFGEMACGRTASAATRSRTNGPWSVPRTGARADAGAPIAKLTTSARRHSAVDVDVRARHPVPATRHEQRDDLRQVLRGPIATERNFLSEEVGRSAQRVAELLAPGRSHRPRRHDVHTDFARREIDRERT